jgi:hypothetical protein
MGLPHFIGISGFLVDVDLGPPKYYRYRGGVKNRKKEQVTGRERCRGQEQVIYIKKII